MVLRKWDDLPDFMKTEEVRPYYEALRKKRFSLFFKRAVDLVGGLVLLIILAIPMAVIAALIKLDSEGPVFYRQERVTTYGKHFRIHKFRTMVSNADKIGTAVTVGNDSRITKVGAKLRGCRLDELPQVLDLISGDMSFVGTRPEAVKYVEKYKPEYMATLLLPAGITSEASIRYKDEAELLEAAADPDRVYVEEIVPQKMKFNLQAIEKFSFWGDIATMFRTVFAVLGKEYSDKEQESNGIDSTNEVGEAIKNTTVDFTADPARLKEAKFIIVAVPTPVNDDTTPDLRPVEGASRTVGQNITPGTIVVFESTVYPGVTEDICVPIIEKESGLKCGVDWKIGYSPERINPGDRVHTLTSIRKIVSGMDEESATEIKKVYDIVIKAGTVPVSTIKTAEAVKVVENSQRDINIAFVNEVAMICDRMGIDTDEVIYGMNSKWNALGFKPGLVGGHCIGVDPYYLTNAAEKLGYHSQIILNGRKVNDSMGAFVADAAIKQMIEAGLAPKKANVVILGITFKENCPDTRNSKVVDIIKRLKEYEINPIVSDSWADAEVAKHEYGVDLVPFEELPKADCLIVAVGHNQFRSMSTMQLKTLFKDVPDEEKVLIDVKSLYRLDELKASGMRFWRL